MFGFFKKIISYCVSSVGMGCEGQGKSVEMRCAVSVPSPETLLSNYHNVFIIPSDNKQMEYICFLHILSSQSLIFLGRAVC